jgi:hypothetical protein
VRGAEKLSSAGAEQGAVRDEASGVA